MELRQLRYFVTLASELHFRKAAERLNITQPPLSQSIKLLEAEIGTPLFERGRKRLVKLTPAGEALYAKAPRILKQLEQAKRDTLRASLGETGLLSIAHTDDFTSGSLADLLYGFHHQYPGAVLRYYQDTSLSMTERLINGELDCIFVLKPTHAALAECSVKTLSPSPVVLTVPENHPLSRRKKVKLKEIANEHHLYSANDIPTAFDHKLAELLTTAGVNIRSNVQSLSTAISLDMVRKGYGVLLASEGSIVNREGIALIAIDDKAAVLERAVVWKEDNANPSLKNFLHILEGRTV
ncbi:MAG: LysR family transcriptional regulator [Oceanicoccus sp.]|uniref:LysR substrate-binding domain-containing protein n=1 Tax=Oceanicoccus sp. TaxID=2691044 RepID=UPI0026340B45|nr:LysR family transcriptional regulator [Oceanicoccus sp.]MDG1772190.1 LysR family transcriptional regulator [Oceanicoccus sp.]